MGFPNAALTVGRSLAGLACGCLMILVVAGCLSRPATPSRNPAEVTGDWPYGPNSILVHPLTRYRTGNAGGVEVEARIEFLDRDGFSTRGVGRLEMTLEDRTSRFVETWILSLGNAKTNRAHYDAITRTYLIRLSLPNQDVPAEAELIATLVLPNGDRLTDARRVTRRPVSDQEPSDIQSEGDG